MGFKLISSLTCRKLCGSLVDSQGKGSGTLLGCCSRSQLESSYEPLWRTHQYLKHTVNAQELLYCLEMRKCVDWGKAKIFSPIKFYSLCNYWAPVKVPVCACILLVWHFRRGIHLCKSVHLETWCIHIQDRHTGNCQERSHTYRYTDGRCSGNTRQCLGDKEQVNHVK